ncbi:hypothetical protein JD527_07540 [Aeromonas veronii]|uniref:hypothetical protein n=1 Tax=Aeromonas veronii TaxID=654 RepID=UPI00191CDAE3|nr:hypothetical protein [Aeromonas veronii]MBL0638696.1 hypothetical protein [Aeromonas veronii]
MNWKTVTQLYSGTLGKALLIIALATPMSFLVKAGINPTAFITSLFGALFILVGYVWTLISAPPIIKNFIDGHDYAVKLNQLKENIDWVSEFRILEDNKAKITTGYDGYFHSQFEFSNIESAKNELGPEQCLRSLSILKYNLINNFNSKQRLCLTVIFIIGAILIYMPLIHRVFYILGVTS